MIPRCFVSTFTPVNAISPSSRQLSTRPLRTIALPAPAPATHLPHFPASTTTMVTASPSPSASSSASPVASSQLSVLLPEKLSDAGVDLLTGDFAVVQKLDLTPETLLAEIGNHDAIIVRSATKVTRAVIEASPRLKVIGRAGVGVDNIDIPAATERGVLVVNAPTGNCIAAAEHSIALMCALARKVAQADATIKGGSWERGSFVGASLVGKTLGVVGLGRIGREVSKRAKGLGMNIVASDPFTSGEAAEAIGVTLAPFEDVCKQADFITVHIPLIESTKGLIDARAIGNMKQGVRVINAARGGIVVEEALLEGLESGKVAGAALDCFEFEPPHKHPDSISAKVVQHPNVVATPHLGASTTEAQLDVAVEIATAVRLALGGELVPTMINGPVMSPELLKEMKPRALLAERLGKLAFYLSGGNVGGEMTVTYHLPNPAEDTRLLRAGVLKGVLEAGLGLPITIVNADGMAKQHGLKLTEITKAFVEGTDEEVSIAVKGGPIVSGRVVNDKPHVTGIGSWEFDSDVKGTMIVYSQLDRPGMMGSVGTLLGEAGINISSMTLARDKYFVDGAKALVLLVVDQEPSKEVVEKITDVVDDDYIKPKVISF